MQFIAAPDASTPDAAAPVEPHDWILAGRDEAGPSGIFYKCTRCGAREQVFRDEVRDGVRTSEPMTVAPTCDEEVCRHVLEE